MGLLDGIGIGNFNIFRQIGKTIGVILIIISLVLAVPGVLTLMASSAIYGSPVDTVNSGMAIQAGEMVTMQIAGVMTAGNNYDIKLNIRADAVDANPEKGSIQMTMTTTKTAGADELSPIPNTDTFIDNAFNSTSFSETYVMDNDFEEDADIEFTFTLDSQQEITDIDITLEVYEDPRRQLSSLLSTIGLILLIPSGLLCCVGVMISGSDEN